MGVSVGVQTVTILYCWFDFEPIQISFIYRGCPIFSGGLLKRCSTLHGSISGIHSCTVCIQYRTQPNPIQLTPESE